MLCTELSNKIDLRLQSSSKWHHRTLYTYIKKMLTEDVSQLSHQLTGVDNTENWRWGIRSLVVHSLTLWQRCKVCCALWRRQEAICTAVLICQQWQQRFRSQSEDAGCCNILFYTCCSLPPLWCVVHGHTLRICWTHTKRVYRRCLSPNNNTEHQHLRKSSSYTETTPQHSLIQSTSDSTWLRKLV